MTDEARYERLKGAVRPAIAAEDRPTPEFIRATIEEYRALPSLRVDEDSAERLAREIESRFDIQMTLGAVVTEGFVEWYPAAKAGITPYYWDRYRLLLEQKDFPPNVLSSLDQVTDRLVGLLQNPEKEGESDRRGMVVGHVQSGKTANYTGLICKAADAGYKLIVVIAGIHNNLRNQTQQRIDEGFIGRDSSKPNKPPIGVSRFSSTKTPITLTNATSDFNTRIAEAAGMEISALNVPLVLVIKKNPSTLRNLTNWLRAYNTGWARSLVDAPMLLIDDEADNASINTSRDPDRATRINQQIRELLNLFKRKCYVGYTATPFANIFIDPDARTGELESDLFPRDFVVTLDPPTNYFGAERIFRDGGDEYLRPIEDHDAYLPIGHKKTWIVEDLPESLREAVRTFVLARTIRVLRGQGASHCSMLINASYLTAVQTQIRNLIHDYLARLERAIRHDGAKDEPAALRNEHIAALHATFEREYDGLEFGWPTVQSRLLEGAASIRVEEVNSTASGSLAYDASKEAGLHVIAVGGYSLSRGLTLEGLTVSYFLRNSMMYDTLLQMGRWFGYRPGYQDLCRIWMPLEAQGWYEHISDSIDELRDELRTMERAKLTPRDFGLRVRTHPDTLIVTARNKMGTAQVVPVKIGLSNSFIETHTLRRGLADLEANRNLAIQLLASLQSISACDVSESESAARRVWTGVPAEIVADFIAGFRNSDRSLQTQSAPVADFIRKCAQFGMGSWDVAIVGRALQGGVRDPDLGVICQKRTAGANSHGQSFVTIGAKNRVSTRGVEKIGLDHVVYQAAEREFLEGKNPSEPVNFPDHIYRHRRTRPLLLVQPIDLEEDGQKVGGKPVIVWSISFPSTDFDHPTVTYMVNSTWWATYGVEEESSDFEYDDE